jgi:hypothetical protein
MVGVRCNMNTMDRMRSNNAIMKRELVRLGYTEFIMFPHTRFFKDIYGLWDGVCKKYVNDMHFELHWVQFKTGRVSPADRKLMGEFCFRGLARGLLVELVKRRVKRVNGRGSKVIRVVRVTRVV